MTIQERSLKTCAAGNGVPHEHVDGRPVIGICRSFSELTPCNSHFRTPAYQLKIDVYEAGGLRLEIPVMSLGEVLLLGADNADLPAIPLHDRGHGQHDGRLGTLALWCTTVT